MMRFQDFAGSTGGSNWRGEAVRNRLLATLSPDTMDAIRNRSTPVRLVHGQIIAAAGQPLSSIYFLLNGLVCLVHGDGDVPSPQLAMIGRDSGVGLVEFFIGSKSALGCALVQVGGTALRISCVQLRDIVDSSPDLQKAGWRSVQDMMRQIMAGSACNATGTVLQRCARWLAMAQERLGGDDVPITHDGLAAMLGVRRSGVTVAAAHLQEQGLIQTGRGRIRILDGVQVRRMGGEPVQSEVKDELPVSRAVDWANLSYPSSHT